MYSNNLPVIATFTAQQTTNTNELTVKVSEEWDEESNDSVFWVVSYEHGVPLYHHKHPTLVHALRVAHALVFNRLSGN